MAQAFLITAYKDFEQLCCLTDVLSKENSNVYIHIDKKSNLLYQKISEKYSHLKNITIINNASGVYWGGFSHLKAILLLINEAFKNNLNTRFHLISGQDFPIKSLTELTFFFEKNSTKEFMTSFELPSNHWEGGGLNRLEYFHLNDILDPKKYFFPRLNGRFLRLQKWLGVKRKKPTYIKSFYGGGTWWSLSREAIKTILDFNTQRPDFINYFKNTHCSEEIFFQTILNNCEFKNEITQSDLRFVNWNLKNGSVPANLDETDLENIIKSESFFARKFDSKYSVGLRNKLIKK